MDLDNVWQALNLSQGWQNIRDKGAKYKQLIALDRARETSTAEPVAINGIDERALNTVMENKMPSLLAGTGGIVANSLLNNPVGGTVDALTFNALNLKDDEWKESKKPIYPPNSLPKLDSEQVDRQLDYMEKRIATDMMTRNALREQQMREDYYENK